MTQFEKHYQTAESFEQNAQWRQARNAWLKAKAFADTIAQSTNEANGRQAYCDYRIAVTYRQENNTDLAIANFKLALAHHPSDINRFLGSNGTSEIQTELKHRRVESQLNPIKLIPYRI